MPDVGSSKYLDKRMKMKGLGRLRWYCTPCEKQCRDANSFKQHTLSESHVRRIDSIDDVRGTINDYSLQFQNDFLNLLKTSHRDKTVHSNRFYQNYIADKNHVHLNSTKWSSLTEFVTYLGRDGLCRVEEQEDGLYVAWIDRSPEALRRAEALKKSQNAEAADRTRDEDIIQAQVERAKQQQKETAAAPAPAAPTALPETSSGPITFQFQAAAKPKISLTAKEPQKQANVFKKAKKNALQDAGKRKRTEQADSGGSEAKRRG